MDITFRDGKIDGTLLMPSMVQAVSPGTVQTLIGASDSLQNSAQLQVTALHPEVRWRSHRKVMRYHSAVSWLARHVPLMD